MPYSTEAQQFFDRLATQPTATRKDRYAALIDSLVADGIWSLLDGLYVFIAADKATAFTNLKSSSYTLTEDTAGTIAFTTDAGVTGNGTNYLNTGYAPNPGGGNFSLNSASIFAWLDTDYPPNAGRSGCLIGNSNAEIYPEFNGDAFFSINTATETSVANPGHSLHLYHADRPDGSTTQGYIDGSQVGDAASPTDRASSSTIKVLWGGADFGDSPTDGTLIFAGFGGSLGATKAAQLYSALNTYKTTVEVEANTVDMAVTEAADTFAASVDLANPVDLAATEAADAFAAEVAQDNPVDLAVTEPADTFAAEIGSPFGLDLAVTEAPDVFAAEIAQSNSLSLTVTEAADTFAGRILTNRTKPRLRTIEVFDEHRRIMVPFEHRSFAIPRENRTIIIPKEGRAQ